MHRSDGDCNSSPDSGRNLNTQLLLILSVGYKGTVVALKLHWDMETLCSEFSKHIFSIVGTSRHTVFHILSMLDLTYC